MAWVVKRFECSECSTLHDDFDDARECCALPGDWFAQELDF